MKCFVAGVGNVTLFKNEQLLLTAKTLVDSSINFSLSLEDIRAGQGAKLYGKYAHTSGLTMKLTDAMWRMEMLAANLGAAISHASGTAIQTDKVGRACKRIIVTDGDDFAYLVAQGDYSEVQYIVTNEQFDAIDVSETDYKEAKPLPLEQEAYIWYAPASESEKIWRRVPLSTVIAADGIIPAVDSKESEEYCIKYIVDNSPGRTIKVSGNFIPDTLTAVVEVPLFSGDSEGRVSTKVGKVIITIPRFMLNGTADISMTMNGASQTPLEGSALAVKSENCLEDEDYYAIISEVVEGMYMWDGVMAIGVEADNDVIKAPIGTTVNLKVRALYKGGIYKLIPYDPEGIKGYKIIGATADSSGGIVVTSATQNIQVSIPGFVDSVAIEPLTD